MPSEGIVYRSGKKNIKKSQNKLTLAEQIAQKRAHGYSSTNFSARSGKSNKTTSDLESVDISHLTKHDDARQTPTPLPTVNPGNKQQHEPERRNGNYNTSNQQPKPEEQRGPVTHNQNMPYKSTHVQQVLPPVSENAGRKRQTGMSNQSVTLPPIQDNNKVVGGNTPMTERSINPNDSEHRRHQQPNRQENLHNNYSNKDKIDHNNNVKYESNSQKKDIDQHKRSRSRSKERAPNKNHDTSVRSKSSAKGSSRRSRSREKKRSSSYSQRHRSNSRNKERTNRSKSRDSSRHRTRSSRRQHKSRESRKRSRSRDSSLRRKSKERRKSSRSKSQDQRRKRSSDRRKNKQRSKSRSSSRHRHAYSEKSVDSRRRKHKSRSPPYESEYRNRRDSFRNDYLKDRRSSRSRNDDDIKYKHKSDDSRSRKSKSQQYERSPSPEYNRDKTHSQSKRNLKHTRSKIHHYYSDDSDDPYESVQSAESRKGNNKKRFGKSHDELRLKSKLHANKHKARHVPLDNEKKYNVIVLEDESEYSSSSEDESLSQKTIYVRSKSQHAAHLKEKRRRSKEYFSDIDTRQHKRPSDRKIIYYSEEQDEIIVQPRKRLEVPMAVRQVNNLNPSQNVQGEQEELFYLVPATNRTISNQQSQNNTLFSNQSEGQRVIRISNQTHHNTANHKLYYGNKSDVVYGQEPQYDDYRPPVQQKYYNPHTNHYRHDNVVPTMNIKDNSLTSHPTHSDVNRLNKAFDTTTSSGRSPDGESSTSSGQSLESQDVNISSMSSHSNIDYRPTTAEKRKALKHLSELSNYNIDVAMGKASLTAPPMTDEALIKKIFNTEFQSQMDDYLRS